MLADPILCYVTNRRTRIAARSLSPATWNEASQQVDVLRETFRKVSEAGVDWIQIREKDLGGRALSELASLAVSDTQSSGCKILVNDRLDVALAAGAAGVHLGENSLRAETVAQWRRDAGRAEFKIGVSCHSLETSRAAEEAGADYIFFGPVFATPSKAAFGAPQGIEKLHEICGAVRIPVLAIGGVAMENATSCFSAGARGIAAIRLFQECEDISGVVNLLRKR